MDKFNILSDEINTCTCTHKRNKHEGYRSLKNKNVFECKEKDCPCQSYSPISKKWTPIQIRVLAKILGVLVVAGIGFAVVGAGISIDKEMVTLSPRSVDNIVDMIVDGNYTTKHYGETVDVSDWSKSDVKELLVDSYSGSKSISAGISLMLMIVIVYIALIYCFEGYEKERRKELLE